jgi:hypothetical protein
MDRFAVGLVMVVVGMGGTLGGLYAIVLSIQLMKRLFPRRDEMEEGNGKGGPVC